MRNYLPAVAVLALIAATAAVPASALATPWSLKAATNATTLVFGAPGVDRDAFRLNCRGGTMTISTWATSPPRGVTEAVFPTRLSVFFERTELVFTATGRVAGPGNTTRIDAQIIDPTGFLASLGQVNRLTTIIFAGRRMATVPLPEQTAAFGKACSV